MLSELHWRDEPLTNLSIKEIHWFWSNEAKGNLFVFSVTAGQQRGLMEKSSDGLLDPESDLVSSKDSIIIHPDRSMGEKALFLFCSLRSAEGKKNNWKLEATEKF